MLEELNNMNIIEAMSCLLDGELVTHPSCINPLGGVRAYLEYNEERDTCMLVNVEESFSEDYKFTMDEIIDDNWMVL